MPTCQRCGISVPATQRLYRRELYSGITQRINYGRRVSYGNSTHYAVKNVCGNCADKLDQKAEAQKSKKIIRLLVVAIIIVIYFLLK